MSYTVQDIITQTQNKIGDTSFSPSEILQYINNTNRDVHNSYQLRYMQKSIDYTTTTGVMLLGVLPTDMQQAYTLRRTDKDFAGKMDYLSFDEFDERYPQPTLSAPSVPTIWYDFSQQIFLFPAPSAVTGKPGYVIQLRYMRTATPLVATTQTPEIPEEFQEILALGALSQAMERRQRFDVSQLYTQQMQQRVLELVQRYGNGSMSETDVYVMTAPIGRII